MTDDWQRAVLGEPPSPHWRVEDCPGHEPDSKGAHLLGQGRPAHCVHCWATIVPSRLDSLPPRWRGELARRLELGQYDYAALLAAHLLNIGELDAPVVLGRPWRRELLRARW